MATNSMDEQANRRVHIIEDLLGAVLLLAALAFVLLLDLTRRQLFAVYQLAFALSATSAFFIVGGLVDHHLSDDQLQLALYSSHLSSSMQTSYSYLPIATSLIVSVVFLVQLSVCSCDCCCLIGSRCASHEHCFGSRIRANVSLYGMCFCTLFVAIGTRLNVRLRESAINPVGGTLHWTALRSPLCLALAHVGSILLVALKLFLQHADNQPLSSKEQLITKLPRSSFQQSATAAAATAATVESLIAPPPIKQIPRSNSSSSSHRSAASLLRSAARAEEIKEAVERRTGKLSRPTSAASSYTSTLSGRERTNDGDVSSLISSDSESDDEILTPSFKQASSSLHRLPTSLSAAYSDYSSSPPSSPTSTTSSRRSAFFSSTQRPPRPRSTSNASSSTALLSGSDNEDPSDAFLPTNYYSDRPSSGSSSSTSNNLRKRAPRADVMRRERAQQRLTDTSWLECIDPSTGSTYYYNQQTGESQWERANY